ncbi:unnamed protein product [Adineta steineri]|uniref:Reverse transcriptase domain-containing protein n=1 Tax=Adineta steineri TaxID=433720 RepID=A0A815NCD3_9BILA|nr:unnamed protein product [Adineta steineri]
MDRLIQLRQTQLEGFEELLKLEAQISIEFLPKNFDHLENFIAPQIYLPVIKNDPIIQYKQQRYKIIQEAKRTWLNIFVDAFAIQYQEELKKFQMICVNDSQKNEYIALFTSCINYINHRTNRIKREIYAEKIPVYRRKLLRHRQRHLKSKKEIVNVRPRIILDLIRHPFTSNELDYLSRGPNYIRPNQSALRSYKQRQKQINTELDTNMNRIKKYMSNLEDPGNLPLTSPLYKMYSDRLRTYLLERYMTPLPLIDQLHARRELKLIKSIQQKLKKYKLILRETDKSSVFHIGYAIDYKQKATKYRQDTGAYEELNVNPFNETIYNVTHALNQLKTMSKIAEYQRMNMIPVREKTQLAYMYFILKSHKKETPLRPTINTIYAATTKISKFLDQLIRPLFDRFVHQTRIIDGVDLLKKCKDYIQNGHLKANTFFVTFDITNLYTMLPQEESLKILGEFLQEHHCDRVNEILIDTIIELGRIVLQANVFVYGNKFYRQIIGGAMGSAFTLTLANIFMWKWEKQTLLSKLPTHEIYGRYIDDVFFTSDDSEENIKKILEKANQFHPNIKLEYHIGQNLPFLDINLHNNYGQLLSSVYHKSAAEPAVLSFVSDHPRHIFRNVIQTALMRPIRYSSTLEVFNIERRTIRLMLLYNSYPSTYINEQFQRFFMKYTSSSSSQSLLPLIANEQEFFGLREKLLAQPSIKQILMTKSANTVEIISNNTDYGNIRLIVGHRSNPNLNFQLSRKRPRSSLLKDPSKKSVDIPIQIYETIFFLFCLLALLLEPTSQ